MNSIATQVILIQLGLKPKSLQGLKSIRSPNPDYTSITLVVIEFLS